MKFLNAQQFAFILDIKKEEARAKMCHAWCREKNITNSATYVKKDPFAPGMGKVADPYPQAMEIAMLAKHLNLPTLQQSCDDIENNYLNRPGSRKWILCDFPEKKLGNGDTLKIPTALESLPPTAVRIQIIDEWKARYPLAKISSK